MEDQTRPKMHACTMKKADKTSVKTTVVFELQIYICRKALIPPKSSF